MRLAFIAVEADTVVNGRRRGPSSYQGLNHSNAHVGHGGEGHDGVFDHTRHHKRRKGCHIDDLHTAQCPLNSDRSNNVYGPILALWHLASLTLFLLATMAIDGVMAEDLEDQFSTGTCHRYDYYLSSSSGNVDLVKRSISPFFPSNPALDNVFAIWLRASRSSRTLDLGDNPINRQRYHYSTGDPVGRVTARIDYEEFEDPQEHPYPTRIQQCELFDQQRIVELCSLDVRNRVAKLRHVFLRTDMATNRSTLELGNNVHYSNYNCNSSTNGSQVVYAQPMTLYTFFQLDISYDGALAKSNPVKHLDPEFRPCVLSGVERGANWSRANSCRTCYGNVLNRLKAVDSRQENFSVSVLSMLDCEPDNDLEQFSPTSNCSECKIWYRRWLLVILTAVWKQKPCVHWCHLAELACPHLPPVKRNDYAGLPSFRCTDPEISTSWNKNSTYGLPCDCMHPCDPLAPTIFWGWNVTAERPEFCRDYNKKRECPPPSQASKPSAKTVLDGRRSTSTTLSTNSVSPSSSATTQSIDDRKRSRTSTAKNRDRNPKNGASIMSGIWTFGLAIYGFIRWETGWR